MNSSNTNSTRPETLIPTRRRSSSRNDTALGSNEGQRDIHTAFQRRLRTPAAALTQPPHPHHQSSQQSQQDAFNLAMNVLRDDSVQPGTTSIPAGGSSRERELMQRYRRDREQAAGERTISRAGNLPWGELEHDEGGVPWRPLRRRRIWEDEVDGGTRNADLSPGRAPQTARPPRSERTGTGSSSTERAHRRGSRWRAHLQASRTEGPFGDLDNGLLGLFRRNNRRGDFVVSRSPARVV